MKQPGGMDKAAISRNFNRAALEYDQHALLQNIVLERLLEQIPVFCIKPARVLDLGSGTGKGASRLRKQYSGSRIIQLDIAEAMICIAKKRAGRFFSRTSFICADADQLPLGDATIDMVFSSLMLQWSQAPDQLLHDLHRVIKPGGLLLFATLGRDTLYELEESWHSTDSQSHVHVFPDIQIIGNMLVQCGFVQPVLSSERLGFNYGDVNSIMKDLKSVGAVNSGQNRRRSLTGKNRYLQCMHAYEQFRRDGKLPATYEIIYGHAWAKDVTERSHQHELRFVPTQEIRPGKS